MIFTSESNEEKPCTIAAAEVEVDFPSIINSCGRLGCFGCGGVVALCFCVGSKPQELKALSL